jgi:2-keto-4-pentenoate hydratase/2-oxohepta-3-ene-1,7-dioic acid hydratase in catechol pathway
MKLCRYHSAGEVKPALLDGQGKLCDVSFFGEDFDERFFATQGLDRLRAWLRANRELAVEVEGEIRLATPFRRPSKIICVGLNYASHAGEISAKPPKEPILFYKSTSALSDPGAPVYCPRSAFKLDYEVELAVVVGQRAQYVPEEEAMACVAGYVLTNDYSERSLQLERKGQWLKGKSHDSFAPFGPFLATADEIPDPHGLAIWLEVNGELRQSANTGDMVFRIPFLISYISQFMTLLPGDVVCTGTPAGVGMGFSPPRFLSPGDVVRYGIEGLGSMEQTVAALP